MHTAALRVTPAGHGATLIAFTRHGITFELLVMDGGGVYRTLAVWRVGKQPAGFVPAGEA